MKYFDFLFYYFCRIYSGYNEKGAEFTASGIVGAFPVLNFISINMLLQLVGSRKVHINALSIIILFVVFQVISFFRYNYLDRYSVAAMDKKWNAESEISQNSIRFILILYSVISVIGTFGLAIYFGSAK